jgi:hypothetical protein
MRQRVLTKGVKGMKKNYFLILAVFVAFLSLILSACSPNRISVEEYNQTQGIKAATEIPETEGHVEEPDPGNEVVEPTPVAETVGEVPEDVPIMDGAYELQAGRSGKNVVYQIDATVQDVVAFYQGVLADYGWEMAGPPDNAVGAIGTMLRENAIGDRLAINMQRNEVGGFVRLSITISRAD